MKSADVKQSSRRGLSFGSVSSDVEMTEMDKNETKDFTIEWQAVVETTLAPLDQFSSLQAKAASTPCIPANQISNQPQEVTDLMFSCLPVTTLYDEGLTPSKHLR
ncbi:unnamed protein product [Lymnaea stagnalis]|uniref:Uncharacterized protein n=1 Tax=Lymnaea stagnalis TaxID=6523 RepID=A0AAV2H7M4_LYMST